MFTKDIDRAIRVSKQLESGQVGINTASPTLHFDMPFGGWKSSGYGRGEWIIAISSPNVLKPCLYSHGTRLGRELVSHCRNLGRTSSR